jgi:ABC-type lipoprotein release transport system permease subunit
MTFALLAAESEPEASVEGSPPTPPEKGRFALKRAPKEPKVLAEPEQPEKPEKPEKPRKKQKPEKIQEPESGLESVLTPTFEWFRSMLRGFLMVYVVGLASVLVWLRTPTSNSRLWIVAALSLPVVYQLLLRPVNRRVALRGIIRRPTTWSTAAAVAIAAAVLATSVTVADSVSRTRGEFARRHLGPVDTLVFAPTESARLRFLAAVERQQAGLSTTEGPRRSGTTSVTESTDGQVLFTSSRVVASSPTVSSIAGVDAIEVAFEDLEKFGNESSATGLSGLPSLGGRMAYIGADLAADLDAQKGTLLTISIGGEVRNFIVERVLPRRAMAALTLDGRPRPRVLFVARGGLSAFAPEGSGLVRYVTAYSVAGPAESTWRQSRTLADLLAQAIEKGDLPSGDDSGISVATGRIEANSVAVKADLQEFEARGSDAFGSVASGLSTIAGVGAVVSLIAALILTLDRRRRELASLRAVGMSRSDALGAVTVELWLVSLASIVVGSTVGWILGAIALGRSTVNSTAFRGGSPVPFPVRVAALSTAIAAAAAVSMATIFIVGIVQLRLRKDAKSANDSVETPKRGKRVLPVCSVIVGLVLLGQGVWKQSGLSTVMGVLVLAALANRWANKTNNKLRRFVRPFATVLLFLAPVLSLIGVRSGAFGAGTFGFLSSVLLVGGCVVVGWPGAGTSAGAIRTPTKPNPFKSAWNILRRPYVLVAKPAKQLGQRVLAEVLSKFSEAETVGPVAVSNALRASITKAQKDHRPIHTIIIRVLSAFGVFSAVVSSILSSSVQQGISTQAADSKGRFQAVVRSDDPAVVSVLRNRPEVSEVSVQQTRFGSLSRPGMPPVRSAIASLDESYSAAPGVARLASRSPKFPSDREAFLALLADPALAIVSEASLQGTPAAKAIGTNVFVADDDSGLSSSLTIIGVARSTAGLGDVLIGPDALDRLRGKRPVNTSELVSFATGVEPKSAVAGLRAQLGIDVESFAGVASEEFRSQRTVSSLIGQLSRIMLLGGLLTSFVIVRSALRDRRRDLASLRTFGAVDGVLRGIITSEYRRAGAGGAIVGLFAALPATLHLLNGVEPTLTIAVPVMRLVFIAIALIVIANAVLVLLAHLSLRGSPAAVLHANANSV